MGVLQQDELQYSVHKPTDYQTAENLARLKVSVNKTIEEKTIKDPEKRSPIQAFTKVGSTAFSTNRPCKRTKAVAAFQPANESKNDLFSEFRKLRAELRDEIRSLKSDCTCPKTRQGTQFNRQSS